MRTTLTLDDDLARRLREQTRKNGKSFKDAVNEALRIGLNTGKALKPESRFRVRARPLGLRPGLSLDNISELLEQTDGASHK